MKSFALLSLLFLSFVVPSVAAELDNRDALEGLSVTKAVFDINQGKPKVLALRLRLIDKTYTQLKAAGMSPDFVLTFRGNASRFLTQGNYYIKPEDKETKREVELWLTQFSERGIPLEQCAIAAGLLNIDTKDFLPEVKVVANGYVSLISYQNRGYALVPME